jgi:NitT/TauT family transport system substrate-binding protein
LNAAKNTGVLCYADWWVAYEKRFFSDEGLDVEFLEQRLSGAHYHGLVSDTLNGPGGPVRNDLMPVEFPALADMASGQLDYYVVAGEHSGCRQIVCPVKSPIRTLADLRGKRIGMRAVEDSLIWEFLIGPTRAGTEPTRWIRSPLPGGDASELEWVKQEFAAGRIDAYIGGDPTPEILKAEGVARLVASNTWAICRATHVRISPPGCSGSMFGRRPGAFKKISSAISSS